MATSTFADNVTFQGNVTFTGSVVTKWDRAQLKQDDLAVFQIPLTDFRVHDAFQTNLPGTAASDDLALIGTAFGTSSPTIQTSDLKNTTDTQRARCVVRIPESYVTGETVKIRVFAGMNTTVASASATVDVEAYEVDGTGGISSDLCTTSATSINNLTNSAKDFEITSSSLAAGDLLDVRISIAISDSATGTAVIGEIGYVALLADIKG